MQLRKSMKVLHLLIGFVNLIDLSYNLFYFLLLTFRENPCSFGFTVSQSTLQ
jgi:hypothetical protein